MKSIRHVAALSLFGVLILPAPGCSASKISVGPETPVTFHLSGGNTVMSFQVAGESGVVWRVVSRRADLTMSRLPAIKYGETPPSFSQEIPSSPAIAPPLVEGEEYIAVAVIFDADAKRTRFVVKDGKVVTLSPD